MVNKRQRMARKRFREENGLLVQEHAGEKQPREEAIEGEDVDRKPMKGSIKSNKQSSPPGEETGQTKGAKSRHAGNQSDRKIKNTLKTHPLRVPGHRPGEACFICKGNDHIAKNCPKKVEADFRKICLVCRQRGHTLKRCPNNPQAAEGGEKMCYNCGEKGHRLSDCPQPKTGGLAHAVCFVCQERGHLSRDCPSNTHGIYPKGGCCKVCGGLTHLAKDCPQKGKAGKPNTHEGPNHRPHNSSRFARLASESGNGEGKHTVFQSGDDLEDDFGEGTLKDLPAGGDEDEEDRDIGGNTMYPNVLGEHDSMQPVVEHGEQWSGQVGVMEHRKSVRRGTKPAGTLEKRGSKIVTF